MKVLPLFTRPANLADVGPMDDADLGCDKPLAGARELDYIIFGICKPDTFLRSQVSSPACNHALRATGRIRTPP